MKSTWILLLLTLRLVGVVLDAEVVAAPERDVARGVLVEERVEEDRLERADPPLAVDERELAEPGGAVVLRRERAQRLRAAVGVEPHRAAGFELDPDPVDQRAVHLERARRRHVTVDASRVGGREHLLARDVREVTQTVDGREVGGVPDGRREETHGQIGAGAVQPDRVEAPLGEPCGDGLERPRALAPGLGGIILVEPADVRDRLPESSERLARLELGIDERGPARRGRRGDAPVRRPPVDDLARVREVRKNVAARA